MLICARLLSGEECLAAGMAKQTLKSWSCCSKEASSQVSSDVTISARMLLNTSKFMVAMLLFSAISIECTASEILCLFV